VARRSECARGSSDHCTAARHEVLSGIQPAPTNHHGGHQQDWGPGARRLRAGIREPSSAAGV